MKKVLYNKFAKLIYLLAVFVAIAGIMVNVFKLVQWEKDKEEAYDKEYSLRREHIFDDMVYSEIGEYIDELVSIYEEYNMEGIENHCNQYFEGFNVIMASTGEEMYKTPCIYAEFEEDDLSWVTDKVQYVKDFIRWGDFYDESEYTLYASTELSKLEYSYIMNKYSYSNIDMDKYLRPSTIDYLSKGILHIKVNATWQIYYNVEVELDDEVRTYIDEEYGSIEEQFMNELDTYIICGAVLILATLLLVISCGRTPNGNKVLNKYETFGTELHIIMSGIAIALGACAVSIYWEIYGNYADKYETLIECAVIAAILVCVVAFYYEVGILIKKRINKRFLSDSFIVKLFKKIKTKIVNIKKTIYNKIGYEALPEIKKLYTKKVILDIFMFVFVIFITLLGCILIDSAYLYSSNEAWAYIIFFIVMALFIYTYVSLSFKEYKHLRIYNRICENVDLVYSGHYNKVDISGDEQHKVLNQIANLSEGFEKSVAKQIEAEKMQVELVANVSHDLKTPLTSIISYVDLLSNEELSPVAADYVKILEDKSARLKAIVADVFDLAKATSGEKISTEELDGVVLMNQVLSDMSDRIEETGMDLRVNISVKEAPITGNGQKLYRVFQNVIDNALKYSMEGTRIYLNADYIENEFIVTIKNVSKYEMEFTEEEILSRFTRGDKARHSEGNGLGLSIAKSFTELCGGSFMVNIDDDIFKVIIKLK